MKHMPPDMKSMLGNTGAQKSIKGILNSAKKMIPIITEMGSSTDSGSEISGINRVHATVKGMRTAPKFMADAKRFSALGKAFHSMREPQADFSFAICFISTAVTQRSLCPHHPRL